MKRLSWFSILLVSLLATNCRAEERLRGKLPDRTGRRRLSKGQIGQGSSDDPGGCSGPGCGSDDDPPDDTYTVRVQINLDFYYGETSYRIQSVTGQNFATQGGFPSASLIQRQHELPEGSYTFTINDTWGDGICCSYGDGYYKVYVETEDGSEELVIDEDGDFGDSDTHTFSVPAETECSGPGCGSVDGPDSGVDGGACSGPGCGSGEDDNIRVQIKTDNYPGETSYTITSQTGQVLVSVPAGTFSSAGYTYNRLHYLESGRYTFRIADTYGDGICCSYGIGFYNVYDGSDRIASGNGNFGSYETRTLVV